MSRKTRFSDPQMPKLHKNLLKCKDLPRPQKCLNIFVREKVWVGIVWSTFSQSLKLKVANGVSQFIVVKRAFLRRNGHGQPPSLEGLASVLKGWSWLNCKHWNFVYITCKHSSPNANGMSNFRHTFYLLNCMHWNFACMTRSTLHLSSLSAQKKKRCYLFLMISYMLLLILKNS